MPAKGWRKDDKETNLDTMVANESGGIDQFLFPKSTLNKLAKQILQQTSEHPMLIGKDSQMVIQRGATLFVNFVYHHAKQIVRAQGRKVVNADDVLKALSEVGFQDFLPVLNEELDKFVKKKEQKKAEKLMQKHQDIAQLTSKSAGAETLVDDHEESEFANGNSNKKMKLTNLMNSGSPSVSINSSPFPETQSLTSNANEKTEDEGEDDEEEDNDDDENDDDDAEVDVDDNEIEEDDAVDENGQSIGMSQLQKEQRELEGVGIENDDEHNISDEDED